MTARYHEMFCDPLMAKRRRVTNSRTGDLCAPSVVSNFECFELREIIELAAGCASGRQAVGDRCHNGDFDEGHESELNDAYRDLNHCLYEFNNYCSYDGFDPIDYDDILDWADEHFPECL